MSPEIAVNLPVRRLARVYTKADATSSQTGRGGTADSYEPQQPRARPSCPDGSK